MPRGQLDGTLLFYKSVLGFEAEPAHELVDPYGLIQSRVLESRDRTVRLPLNATASQRTATARFLANYGGGGAHPTAVPPQAIFATTSQIPGTGFARLRIPGASFERLAGMHAPVAQRMTREARLRRS